MIEKTNVLKMAKHVFHRSNGRQDHHIMHPYREWMIGFCVAVALFIAGGVIGLEKYLSYDEFYTVGSDVVAEPVLYREKQVKSAIDLYSARQERFDQLVSSLPVVEIEEREVASTTENEEPIEEESDDGLSVGAVQCEVDADCLLVQPDCEDCTFAAIAVGDQDSFLSQKTQQCELNPPEVVCDIVFEGEVKCVENACQAVE